MRYLLVFMNALFRSIVSIPRDAVEYHIIVVGLATLMSCVLFVNFYVGPIGSLPSNKLPVFLSDAEAPAEDVYRFAEGRVDADVLRVTEIQQQLRIVYKFDPHATLDTQPRPSYIRSPCIFKHTRMLWVCNGICLAEYSHPGFT